MLNLNYAVPEAPNFVNVSNNSAGQFTVVWEEPKKIPGILQNYNLIIQPKEPMHYIPVECVIDDSVFYDSVEATTNEYQFMSHLPNWSYDVQVTASTRAGSGPSTTASVTTVPGS